MKQTAKILLSLIPAAMAASLIATPVEAHGRRDHRQATVQHQRSHGDHHRRVVRIDRRERFRVPARILRHDERRFRSYFVSSAYYRPHRHRHYVYEFPVWTPRGYVFRTHDYCDGALFSRGRIEYHGRHISFGFDF